MFFLKGVFFFKKMCVLLNVLVTEREPTPDILVLVLVVPSHPAPSRWFKIMRSLA